MEKLMEMFVKGIAGAALVVGVIAAIAVCTAFPVKWCWNYTMPYLFHLPEIGFWHAFCLTWLAGSFIKASPSTKS